MKESEAWLLQVESDSEAIRVLSASDVPILRCQIIAKCQQIVEKSLNSIDAILREEGLIVGVIRASHYPERLIERLLRVIGQRRVSLTSQLSKILSSRWRTEIRDLCLLAPKLPSPGDLYTRNTEYPYNLVNSTEWTAPGDSNSFTNAEVERFLIVANHMRQSVAKLAIVIRMVP